MDPYADRSYLHAKIYALYDSLLKKKDYSEIINLNNLLPVLPGTEGSVDASNYLKIKESVFRSQTQKILDFIEANEFYKPLLKAFLYFFELRNLKLILSKAYGKNNIIELWYDTHPHNIFDRVLPGEVTTPEGLREVLGSTFLGEVYQTDETPDYKTLETRIDYAIIKNLLQFSKELFPEQRQIFFNIAAMKIISIKIIWSIRLRLIYKWENEQIEDYFLNIDELIRGYKEIQNAVPALKIKIQKAITDKFQDISQIKTDDILDLEFFLERNLWLYISKLFHKDFHGIHPVASYLCLLYYQIQNLFSIIEGFCFKVPNEVIHKRIICED